MRSVQSCACAYIRVASTRPCVVRAHPARPSGARARRQSLGRGTHRSRRTARTEAHAGGQTSTCHAANAQRGRRERHRIELAIVDRARSIAIAGRRAVINCRDSDRSHGHGILHAGGASSVCVHDGPQRRHVIGRGHSGMRHFTCHESLPSGRP